MARPHEDPYLPRMKRDMPALPRPDEALAGPDPTAKSPLRDAAELADELAAAFGYPEPELPARARRVAEPCGDLR